MSIEDKVENLYLKYLEYDIDLYARKTVQYMNNKSTVSVLYASAIWTIQRAINGEDWSDKKEKDSCLLYCWDKFIDTVEVYEKRMMAYEKRIARENKVAGFVR